MKPRLKMKNKSQRYSINKLRPRHVHKYAKGKMCVSIMIVTCIKQDLNNILSSIYEKAKQNWGWVEKKPCLQKKRVYLHWRDVLILSFICL